MSIPPFPYNFTQSTYNTLLSFLGIGTLMIPFFGKVYDGRRRPWYKRLKANGWSILALSLIIVFVNNIKDDASVKQEQIKTDTAIKEKKAQDALARKINEAYHLNTIEALAKYNLRYDSAQKVVIKMVRDSAKRVSIVNRLTDPNLVINSIELTGSDNNTDHLKIILESKFAPSEGIHIKLFTIVEKNGVYALVSGNGIFFANGGTIGGDEGFVYLADCIYSAKPDAYYFLLIGTYQNADKKIIPIKRIYSFSLSSKTLGQPLEPLYTKLKEIFITKGLWQ